MTNSRAIAPNERVASAIHRTRTAATNCVFDRLHYHEDTGSPAIAVRSAGANGRARAGQRPLVSI